MQEVNPFAGLSYQCRTCGKVKPAKEYRTWIFGPHWSKLTSKRHYPDCLECAAKKMKEKEEYERNHPKRPRGRRKN